MVPGRAPLTLRIASCGDMPNSVSNQAGPAAPPTAVDHDSSTLSKDTAKLRPSSLPLFFKHLIRNPDIDDGEVHPANPIFTGLVRQFGDIEQFELEILNEGNQGIGLPFKDDLEIQIQVPLPRTGRISKSLML
jgi:hypothetical protein